MKVSSYFTSIHITRHHFSHSSLSLPPLIHQQLLSLTTTLLIMQGKYDSRDISMSLYGIKEFSSSDPVTLSIIAKLSPFIREFEGSFNVQVCLFYTPLFVIFILSFHSVLTISYYFASIEENIYSLSLISSSCPRLLSYSFSTSSPSLHRPPPSLLPSIPSLILSSTLPLPSKPSRTLLVPSRACRR